MNKVVINGCYGGFELSVTAYEWFMWKHNLNQEEVDSLDRHDSRLVECIETLGSKANCSCSLLYITEIHGNKYVIQEYDGLEKVIEPKDINWIEIQENK